MFGPWALKEAALLSDLCFRSRQYRPPVSPVSASVRHRAALQKLTRGRRTPMSFEQPAPVPTPRHCSWQDLRQSEPGADLASVAKLRGHAIRAPKTAASSDLRLTKGIRRRAAHLARSAQGGETGIVGSRVGIIVRSQM